MELLAFLVFAGSVFVVVGAILGTIANRRTNVLQRRVDTLERKLKALASAPVPEVTREATRPEATPPETPRAAAPAPFAATGMAVPPPLPEHVGDPDALASAEASARSAAASPRSPAESPRSAAASLRSAIAGAPADGAATPMEDAPLADDRGAAAAPPPLPQEAAAPTTAPQSPFAEVAAGGAPPAASSRQLEGVERTGMRWLTWSGIALLFLGISFFLKYAYDRDWLGHLFGPRLRIATATTAAAIMAVTGWRSLRRGMVALGQGLLGGGQALLYLTIFAAFQPAVMVVDTPLLGTSSAFVLMVLLTAAGLATAVRLDAVPTAFLAVLGGFATPVMVSSGQDARDALFAYLLLLDLGVLGVALYRRWRALDVLAFAGTVVLFAGWYAKWYDHHDSPDVATLLWLVAFHLVFLLLPFAHHWLRRSVLTGERFALALANLAWTLSYAVAMLREPAPGTLAGGCFGGAGLYLGLGLATARRVDEDRRTRDGFFAFAALLLTLGLFYLLPVDGITTAWFAEATVLAWLGHRHAHAKTRVAALVVLVAALVRTVVVHVPEIDVRADFVWNRWFATVQVAALGLAAFALVHRRCTKTSGERQLASACGIVAGCWALAASSVEIARHAAGHAAAWTSLTPALAIAWLQLAGTLLFLLWTKLFTARATFLAAFLPLTVAAIAVIVAYGRYAVDALPVANGCCLAGLAVLAVLALTGVMAQRVFADGAWAARLHGTAQLALTALATTETLAWLQRGEVPVHTLSLAQALGWVWLATAVGGALTAAARSSQRVLALAGVPLVLACGAGFVLFAEALHPHRLVANQRFLFAAACSGVVAGIGTLLQRLASRRAAETTAASALVLLLSFAACESVAWSAQTYRGAEAASWTVWLLGASTLAGGVGGLWRSLRTDNASLRGVAVCALTAALLLALTVYLTAWDAELMFANARASLVAAAVAALWLGTRGDDSLRGLRYLAFAAALVATTAEPPVWFLDRVADRAEAQRLALFSVTVTWSVVAVLSLVVGFRADRRPLRMLALALFALTAVKLLLLDMSGAQQLYRILAFVLVGIVFVGASWLYHRAERRLQAK